MLSPSPHPAPSRPAARAWRHRPGWAASLALCAALAGCGTPPPARPPGSGIGLGAISPASISPFGPSARLLLRGAVQGDDRYAVVQLSDSQTCQGPRVLTGGNAKKAADPASIEAGKLTTLDFAVLQGNTAKCVVRWSFTPQAGKSYLVQGIAMGAGCTARLMDVSIPDRPVPPSDAVMRNAPGQPCIALDKARAAGDGGSLIQGGQLNGEAVLNPNATTQDLQGLIRP